MSGRGAEEAGCEGHAVAELSETTGYDVAPDCGRVLPYDERFMRMALAMGRRTRGITWPNPSVGAVIVADKDGVPVVVGTRGDGAVRPAARRGWWRWRRPATRRGARRPT